MSKEADDSFDGDRLSRMTVVELREICKNLQLMVSGNKLILIDRILEFNGNKERDIEVENEQVLLLEDDDDIKEDIIGDAVDKLIIKKIISKNDEMTQPKVTLDLLEDKGNDILEAEIFVEENSLKPEIMGKDDSASMVITLPSLKNINLNTKVIGAIFAIILLLGATVFLVLNNNNSFSAKPLNYGDEMNFNVDEVRVSIIGDDMVKIFSDSSGGILDEACGELEINKAGEGKVSISRDEKISTDSLGRSGFYTAEKKIEHDLVVDFEGKTWRDTDDCGNLGWSMANNILDMNSMSWTELEDKDLKRTNTDISFTAVSYTHLTLPTKRIV